MRVSLEKRQIIKSLVQQKIPCAAVYIFGSRTNDERRGGDIDILVIGDRALTLAEKIRIKSAFFARFGEQKIDVVSFTQDTDVPFKYLALEHALQL